MIFEKLFIILQKITCMVNDNFFKEEDNGANEIDYLDLAAEMEKVNQVNGKQTSSETTKKKNPKAKKGTVDSKDSSSDEIISIHVYLPKSLHYRMKGAAYFSNQSMSHFLFECILDGLDRFAKEQQLDIEDYVKEQKNRR